MNGSLQPNGTLSETTRGTALIVVESSIFIIFDLAALLGNSLVCFAFYRNRSLRTVTNYFVLSLAITDVATATFVMPLKAVSTIASAWIFGELGCKVDYFFVNVLSGVSLLTVMLLAINRYFKVVRPIFYPTFYSKNRAMVMAIFAWIVTVVVVTLQSFTTRLRFQTFTIIPTICKQLFQNTAVSVSSTVVQNTFIAVPSLVVVFCYVQIHRTVHYYNRATAPLPQELSVSYGVEERRVTKILTATVAGFYVCWLPVLIGNILHFFKLSWGSAIIYINFYYTFPVFASSVVNPIIYAIMSQAYRKEFLNILRIFF